MYVGRIKGSNQHFGNAFTHLSYGEAEERGLPSRREACQAFEDWIRGVKHQEVNPQRRQWILDNLHTLKGKDLVCYCAPLECHAETLIKLVQELEDN